MPRGPHHPPFSSPPTPGAAVPGAGGAAEQPEGALSFPPHLKKNYHRQNPSKPNPKLCSQPWSVPPGPLLQLNTPLPNFLLVPQGHPIPWVTQRDAPQKAAGASRGGQMPVPSPGALGMALGSSFCTPPGQKPGCWGALLPSQELGEGEPAYRCVCGGSSNFQPQSSLAGSVHSVPGVLGRGNAFVVIFDISISGEIGTEGGTPQYLHRWLRFASAFSSTGHRNGQVLYSYCHGY